MHESRNGTNERRLNMIRSTHSLTALASAMLAASLLGYTSFNRSGSPGSDRAVQSCDPENGGITLPDGFCATVFADDVGGARHLAVTPNGDVFVAARASRSSSVPSGILALRDSDGDGRADVRHRIDEESGTGLALHNGYLYFGRDGGVVRYPLNAGQLEPAGPAETVVRGLPDTRSHRAKSIAITADGRLFVNIGSPSNACQQEDRTAGSPGIDPCPQLETRAGIWAFDAERMDQSQADGRRYATGLRNTVALAIDPADGSLYGAVHGRDQLSANWPELYTEADNAELPSEKLVRIEEGDDFGWPYCYHDPELDRLVLAPEYGGDASQAGRCVEMKEPLAAYPAHWAPNGLLFYHGTGFPERYRDGVFIAFHGSWNRAPLPQGGYKVVFQPFEDGAPTDQFETFADGFAGEDKSPRGADHRPVGLAQGPAGELYISDDRGGRIWRVVYVGG
jgi:glucose/arabinose dehydrogenase